MPSSFARREAHRPVYDAFTTTGGAGLESHDPFVARSNTILDAHAYQETHVFPMSLRPLSSSRRSMFNTNIKLHSTQVAWPSTPSDKIDSKPASTKSSSSSPIIPRLSSSHISRLTASFDSPLSLPHPNDLIVSLPNSVVESARRPSTQEGSGSDAPAKAPGDVSMSPQQLLLCLSAASKKLSPNIYRGVQLRISELKEAIDEGRISERCLKSLNYVVDSIDRGKYEDAHTFFDRLKAECPDEMGPWAQQGVRLLINELRRPTSRIRSAGPHLRT